MWFILQCISRAIEGIAVTELEVATFATYVFWWNKPLNVSRPVLVNQDEKKTERKGTSERSVDVGNRAFED